MSSHPIPAALAAFAHRKSIGTQSWAARGHLELRIDARTRVSARPGRRAGGVVLEVRLTPLPSAQREREELLARLMLHVTAGAATQLGALALSTDGEHVVLQADLDGNDSPPFEAALEAFLNETDYWIALARRRRS